MSSSSKTGRRHSLNKAPKAAEFGGSVEGSSAASLDEFLRKQSNKEPGNQPEIKSYNPHVVPEPLPQFRSEEKSVELVCAAARSAMLDAPLSANPSGPVISDAEALNECRASLEALGRLWLSAFPDRLGGLSAIRRIVDAARDASITTAYHIEKQQTLDVVLSAARAVMLDGPGGGWAFMGRPTDDITQAQARAECETAFETLKRLWPVAYPEREEALAELEREFTEARAQVVEPLQQKKPRKKRPPLDLSMIKLPPGLEWPSDTYSEAAQKGETIVQYLERAWKELIAVGIGTRQIIEEFDSSVIDGIKNYTRKRTNKPQRIIPSELRPLTISEVNTRLINSDPTIVTRDARLAAVNAGRKIRALQHQT